MCPKVLPYKVNKIGQHYSSQRLFLHSVLLLLYPHRVRCNLKDYTNSSSIHLCNTVITTDDSLLNTQQQKQSFSRIMDNYVCLKMHIYMSVDVTSTRIAISFHIYCTRFSFKRVMLNFPEGMNKVFELN